MDADLEFATATRPAAADPSRPCLAYGLFLLGASLYLLPFMRLMLTGTDEGTFLEGGVRVVHGQVFARDFFEVVGPGTLYWLAAFFRLFGVTFLATRVDLFVTSLGTLALLYFLSRRLLSQFQAVPCLLFAGASFGALWPAISHHGDSNFFALLAVACFVLGRERRAAAFLLAAGAFAGVATCIHQPKGMLLLFAFLAWLGIQFKRRAVPLSSVGLILAGYASVVAATLLYFLGQGALSALAYANYLWPSRNYSAVNVVPYAQGLLSNYWDHWAIARGGFYWTLPLAALLLVPLLFAALLPALLLLLAAWHRSILSQPLPLLLLLCGSAVWLSEFHRKDIYHLVAGSPLLAILCIHLIAQSRGKFAVWALQLLSICGACLCVFNLFLVLTAHTIQTRVGPVATFQPDPALAYLDAHVPPGEAIFAYPYCPMYYFLSQTENPTPYSFLMYRYNTPAQYQEAIRILEQRQVRHVVWNTGFAKAGIRLFSPTATWASEGDQLMEPYLQAHYNVVWSSDTTLILERKAIGNAKP